jgi:hypothetical protein
MREELNIGVQITTDFLDASTKNDSQSDVSFGKLSRLPTEDAKHFPVIGPLGLDEKSKDRNSMQRILLKMGTERKPTKSDS